MVSNLIEQVWFYCWGNGKNIAKAEDNDSIFVLGGALKKQENDSFSLNWIKIDF